jgi:peptide/nickel transport system ATP-binding protein
MGLLSSAMRAEGRVVFEGRDLLALPERERVTLRGRRMAMVFQEPMTSLNPLHRVGDQVAEPLIRHEGRTRKEALAEAVRLLDRVGIARAAERVTAYPHELSGGQRQRVMIAMALTCRPALLIADEPTSALDVTVQAELVELLNDLVAEYRMGLIVISHDLGVVADLAARTLVLYGGAPMEEGPTRALFRRRANPYTAGLLAALPGRARRGARLEAILGAVPAPIEMAVGCPFHGRCAKGDETCRATPPTPVDTGVTTVWCHLPEAAA